MSTPIVNGMNVGPGRHDLVGFTRRPTFMDWLLGRPLPLELTLNVAETGHQGRIRRWVESVFDYLMPDVMGLKERRLRFFEEACELAQACGMTADEAKAMIDYTWSRPADVPEKEVGGLMVCALGLAEALDLNAEALLIAELDRIEDPAFIEKIHAKHARKIDAGITA